MHFAGYLAGASQKRSALESSAASLAAEIEATERLLQETFAETKKLEHLIERARLQTEKRQRRREAATIDGVALARFGASRASR
jgi:flagellar export protein FliJ